MRIAVMSDSHDNLWKLEAAGPTIDSSDAVIHCGDLCSPFMVRRLGQLADGKPVHIVWGNNDGDTFEIGLAGAKSPGVTLHGQLAEIELDGLRVAVNHYPQIARGLAHAGLYDLVCYGHDHQRFEGKVGDCLLLNPGELMGMKGASTLAHFETATRQLSWIELP